MDFKIDDFEKSLCRCSKQPACKQWAFSYAVHLHLLLTTKDYFKARGNAGPGAEDLAGASAKRASKLKTDTGAEYVNMYPALAGLRWLDAAEQPVGLGRSWSKRGHFHLRILLTPVAGLEWQEQDFVHKDKWPASSKKRQTIRAVIVSMMISSTCCTVAY